MSLMQGPRFSGRGVDGASHPNLSTRKADPNTPLVLAMWRDGIPTETIAKAFGLTENAVRTRASNHGARRPAMVKVEPAPRPAPAKPKEDPSRAAVLEMWRDGVPVEDIAARFGLTPNAIRIRACIADAKRPENPTTAPLLAMWRDGVPTGDIAAHLGMSEDAVRNRASDHGAKRPAWYVAEINSRKVRSRWATE